MVSDVDEQDIGPPRWRYLLLAVAVFLAMWVVLAILWQMPTIFPGLQGADVTATLSAPTPHPATATPAVRQPTITHLAAKADDKAQTITFHLAAVVPPGRQVAEAILWYDTEAGHELERTYGPLSDRVSIRYKLDAAQESLTTTLTASELDYWWLVRDTAGESVRAGGSVVLGPALQSLVVTPTVAPAYVDFTWATSDTRHFQFYYVPGSAAERDRFELGSLAEGALARVTGVLEMEFDEQMDIYLVPRIFWQGGAAYGGKIQLISYLDRNYTDVETWSYFTHEGTHALAQDLPQPKENGGSPDGVLVEGLAVWASGGHYRLNPIDAWAAVTADSDEYIPLADLRAGPFYDFQHELSYLQAASFVKFLVERYGLDRLKELYGRATSDPEQDEALVQELFDKSYAELEADWLDYLDTLSPTPEQAETLRLQARSFDLMRRYETELDPDARLLPPKAPPEWTTDTLEVFLHRSGEPVNLVLETALIAAQARLRHSDLEGTASLLDDVEAALDAGGKLVRPSLQNRQAILALVGAQDRAILRADENAYRDTLDAVYARKVAADDLLQLPFTAYEQEVVRLDVTDDGLGAKGIVLVHAQMLEGIYPGDGQLFAVTFVQQGGAWLMTGREPWRRDLALPFVRGD